MSIIAEIHKDLEQGAIRLIAESRDCLMAEAMRLCGDSVSAEDLLIRTFSKAVVNIDQHKPEKDLLAWMKAIMRNLHLPMAYRQAVLLHYFSEMSVKDIAILLKMPLGTIFWRLNIARKMLAKDLAVKLGKKKPLAVLFAVLLGAGALFGAWQVVETILASPTPTPTTTPTPTPTSTPTAVDPTAPVMTYPTFSSESTASAEPVSTKQKESTMTTIKKTLLAAFSAVSLASTANAVDVEAVKTRVMPAGAVATQVGEDAGAFTYTLNNGTEQVVVFATVGLHTYTLPPNVDKITYLVVGGGGVNLSVAPRGGSGIGGDGGANGAGRPGAANTGSGGGGSGNNYSSGGDGASGIVIIRYVDASACAHTWVEEAKVDETCETDGSCDEHCSKCGETRHRVLPAGHVPEEMTQVAPTATTTGLEGGIVCSRCSAVLEPQKVVPKLCMGV